MIKKIGIIIITIIAVITTITAFYLVILATLDNTDEPKDPEEYQDVTIVSMRKENTGMSCYKHLFTTRCDIRYAYYINGKIVPEAYFYKYQEGKTYSCYEGKIRSSCRLKDDK